MAVESLESLVLDTERTVCLRIMAWVKLLKIWGALRFDDMQKIKPADLQLTGGQADNDAKGHQDFRSWEESTGTFSLHFGESICLGCCLD